MFKHQFQSDVFEEQVFSRTQDSEEALLLLFGHGKGKQLEQYSLMQGDREWDGPTVLTF